MGFLASAGSWLDRHFGRGSYYRLRDWIDPDREWSEYKYGRLLDQHLNSTTRWLDAGCGHQVVKINSATLDHELVRRVPLAVGCDLDLPSLRNHRSMSNVLCCTLDDLPFRDGTFDVVSLNYVAEHLEKPEQVFAGISRLLSPNGILIIHTPNAAGYLIRFIRFVQRLVPRSFAFWWIRYLESREPDDVFPTFYRANSRRQLADVLRPAGMVEENIMLLAERPLFYFFAPLCALELLLTRGMMRLGFQDFAAITILAVFRRVQSTG